MCFLPSPVASRYSATSCAPRTSSSRLLIGDFPLMTRLVVLPLMSLALVLSVLCLASLLISPLLGVIFYPFKRPLCTTIPYLASFSIMFSDLRHLRSVAFCMVREKERRRNFHYNSDATTNAWVYYSNPPKKDTIDYNNMGNIKTIILQKYKGKRE